MFEYDTYCLENEIWKPIPGYEGIYEASSLGRIRSVDGKTTQSVMHGVRKWKGRILKNKTKIPCKGGYKVSLWKNKKTCDFLVARLICISFYGIPENYKTNNVKLRMTVNHKDGNRFNNNVENLEWLSIGDNIRHAFDTGLMTTEKPIMLICSGIKTQHKSLASASRYLGKNSGYLSGQIKRKQKIYNERGDLYEVYEANRLL